MGVLANQMQHLTLVCKNALYRKEGDLMDETHVQTCTNTKSFQFFTYTAYTWQTVCKQLSNAYYPQGSGMHSLSGFGYEVTLWQLAYQQQCMMFQIRHQQMTSPVEHDCNTICPQLQVDKTALSWAASPHACAPGVLPS